MNDPHPGSPDRPHWSESITSTIAALEKHPRIMIASDFDGTLSPIVERPEDAILAASVRMILEELASLHPRVCLTFVSGRSLDDLTQRVKVGGEPVFAGNHGLEINCEGTAWVHPAVKTVRVHLDELLACFEARFAGIPGIELEDKGHSVTLHYRRMNPDWLPLLNETLESIPLPDALRRHEGKMVHEFRPAIDWNKGLAIRQIAASLHIPHEAVVFLGDDITDEDAFREVGPGSTTVHVGEPSKPSLARLNADDPDDVARFLSALLEALRG